MSLETATYISDLVATNPPGSDPKSQGDDHLRLIKSVLKNTFPNINGAVTATEEQINSQTAKSVDFDAPGGAISVAGKPVMSFGADTSGQPFSFRNKITNGNFDIWQRGAPLVVSEGVAYYTADRWRAYAGASGSLTINRGIFDLGQVEVPGQPTYYAYCVNLSGGTFNFRQRIENVRTLSGGKATLSFYARASVPITLDVQLSQSFGTGGSPSAPVSLLKSISLATYFKKFSLTYDLASISGKTLGSNRDDFLEVILLCSTPDLAYSISNIQLEEGSIATAFEQRPISVELAMCQWYYERFSLLYLEGYGSAGAVTGHAITYAEKRITPVVSLSNLSNITNCTNIATNVISPKACSVNVLVTAQGQFSISYDMTISAEL